MKNKHSGSNLPVFFQWFGIAAFVIVIFSIIYWINTSQFDSPGPLFWIILAAVVLAILIFILKSRIKFSGNSANVKIPIWNWKTMKPIVTLAITGILIYFFVGFVIKNLNRVGKETVSTHYTYPQNEYRYIKMGVYHFHKDVPQYYNRVQKGFYAYPAVPGQTIILHFQEVNDPSSSWDYKVTRRPDGTVQDGDDEKCNNNDKLHYGVHSITLISNEDADVVFSLDPPPGAGL